MKKQFNRNHITTLISRATAVQGNIHFSGTLEIEGSVSGNITADRDSSASVRVREAGTVRGEINVPRIVINGTVEGDVYAGEHVVLGAKAAVKGNIYYASMEMVMGAEVNGSLHRSEAQEVKRLGVDRAPTESRNPEDADPSQAVTGNT